MRLTFTLSIALLPFLSSWAQLPKPNIIVVFADDLGYGEIEPYGQKIIKTPNLKRLAEEGMLFTDFYSSSALCAPARCQLLTGLHSGHGAIRANFEMANGLESFTDAGEKGQLPLPSSAHTIAEMLRPLGYATACIGKWGLGMAGTEGDPNTQGFDYFFGYLDQKQAHNYYPTHLWENGKRVDLDNPFTRVHTKINPDQISDETFSSFIGNEYAVDAMAKKVKTFIATQKQPYFLYYAITLPHLALQVPAQELTPYLGKFEEAPYLGDNGYCPVRYPRATYAAMISYLDKKVGEIMDHLDENGQRKNTLILFTSDNGPASVGGDDPEFFDSNGKLRDYKGSLYEGGIRVPFIASWPGKIQSASVSGTPGIGYDIKATLAEVLNIKMETTDGQSLWPALIGGQKQKRNYLYFELSEYSGQQAVRDGNWKLVKRNMIKDKNAPWELYNLSTDIGEQKNVADLYPKIVKRLEKLAVQAHRHHATVPAWNFMEQ